MQSLLVLIMYDEERPFEIKKNTIWIIHSIIIDYTFLYIMLSSRLTSDGNILILYSWFLYMYIELGIFKPRFSNDSFIVTCIAYNNGNIACCWWSSSSWRFIMFILYVYIYTPFFSNKVIFNICICNIFLRMFCLYLGITLYS